MKVSSLLNVIDRKGLISVDLVHVADPNDAEGEPEGERILKEVSSILDDEYIPSAKIDQEVRKAKDMTFELSQTARNYDLVVMGKPEQNPGHQVFDPVSNYIVTEQDVSILTVR